MSRRRIPARERAAIFAAAEGRCHICGLKIDAGRERWDVEHVIPLEMGGGEAPGSDNLQPAHQSCHRDKSKADVGHIAKAKRMRQRDLGIRKQPKAVVPGSKASPWARRYDREKGRFVTVRRETGEGQ